MTTKQCFKILIATNGFPGILAIGELFALGYRPEDITIVSINPDELFYTFCRSKELKINHTFDKYDYNILLSVNFPKLISTDVLNRATVGAINLHPALTQKYRGRWNSSWAIINNEHSTGYTWHYMDEDFDTGDIICQEQIDISPHDTAHSLYYKIYQSSFSKLGYVLDFAGKPGYKQQIVGTYYNKNIPHGGKIDPHWSDDQVKRFQRAMYFPPFK